MLNGVCVNVAHWFTRHPILSLDHKHNFHTHTARATLAALTQVPHAAARRAQRSRSRKPETELTEHTVEFVTHDSRKPSTIQATMQAAAAESAAGHEGHAPITFKVEYGMS